MKLNVEHSLRQDLGSTERDCISEIASHTSVSIFPFLHFRVIQQLPQIGILSSNIDSSIKGGCLRSSPFPIKQGGIQRKMRKKQTIQKEKKCEYCSKIQACVRKVLCFSSSHASNPNSLCVCFHATADLPEL